MQSATAARAAALEVLRAVALLMPLALAGPGEARAQTQTSVGVPGDGHGSTELTFQYLAITERTEPGGEREFGKVTNRALYFHLEYGITDRLALSFVLPYRSNRYEGDFPHDPRTLETDHGQRFLDDGEFHSNWADAGVGLRYLWLDGPVAVTPFVSLYVPTNDYPLFTETQAGVGLWRFDFGVNLGGRFPRPAQNLYWELGYAYSYMEKTEIDDFPDRRVNHGKLRGELGYYLRPDVTLRLGATNYRTYNGLDFPADFNPPFTDDLFYNHDRLFKWEQTYADIGIDWRFGDRYELSVGYGRTVDLVFGHRYDDVYSIGLSRGF